MKCPICEIEFEPKRSDAKTCGKDRCRKALQRRSVDETLEIEGLPKTIPANELPIPPKKEDAPFEPEIKKEITTGRPEPGSPEWYRHGTLDNPSKTWQRVCVLCGEKYTTSLEYARFCSNNCREQIMVVIANGAHPNYSKGKK